MDITFEKVSYAYQVNTPFEYLALEDVNFKIEDGSFTALIGHTGSGKSTILQHLNALVKPTKGKVIIGDTTITPESNLKGLKSLRKKVGLVFQFPEAQLFEETVGKDIAFGPQNFGVAPEEAMEMAKQALELVGLNDSYLDRSPFDLSGGQMRRVAIAGVLAMQPEVLVLDEPTAGLDPAGSVEMMALFERLHTEKGMTIVLVSHQMDDVAKYADKIVVLEGGTTIKEGTPVEVFSDPKWLKDKQLGVPTALAFYQELVGFADFKPGIYPLTLDQLADTVAGQLEGVDHVR